MEETLHQKSPSRRMGTPNKQKFNLFIACESQSAYFKARKVQSKLEALFGTDTPITRAFWSFSLLRYPQLRKHATAEAAAAQMIVVAIDGTHELPPQVISLLEKLPVRTESGQAALVALICPERGTRNDLLPHPQIALLRQIAEKHGLDFFCNQDGLVQSNFFQPACESAEARTVAENLISYYIPWSAGASVNRFKKQTLN